MAKLFTTNILIFIIRIKEDDNHKFHRVIQVSPPPQGKKYTRFSLISLKTELGAAAYILTRLRGMWTPLKC